MGKEAYLDDIGLLLLLLANLGGSHSKMVTSEVKMKYLCL